MAVQYSTSLRNSILEAIEIACAGQAVNGGSGTGGSVTGTFAAPKLRILTGTPPANAAAAQTGTLLVEMTLPADFYAASSGGSKALNGTWQANATAAGTAGYYRVVDNAGTTCNEQGTITASGGGGDMTLDNTSIASGQQVTITAKTISVGGA